MPPDTRVFSCSPALDIPNSTLGFKTNFRERRENLFPTFIASFQVAPKECPKTGCGDLRSSLSAV